MRKLLPVVVLALLVLLPASADAFGKNKVRYHGFDWYYIQTSEFDIYFYRGTQDLAEFAADVLAGASRDLSLRLRHTLHNRVPVIVYASNNDFQMTNIISQLIPEGVAGFTESGKSRVVVPFNGSYDDFRHVLHHELVHVYQYDILYGSLVGSVFSRNALFRMPLWLAEGMAEYYSLGGWDVDSDMYLRDATVSGYLYPPDMIWGFMVYREGQSLVGYIAERWGEDRIPTILRKANSMLSTKKAVKAVLGIEWDDLVEDWQKAMRKRYWPEIASRDEAPDFARELTDHDEDGSHFNEKPAFSPNGDRIAFFSDRSDYTEIYVMSTVDGRILSRLTKAERSGDLESLHAYVSGITWSPDGGRVAFVAKRHGEDVIYVMRVRDKKVVRTIEPGLSTVRDPDWSPDGNRIAFYGVNGPRPDIYIHDLESNVTRALTADYHDDSDPTWSPDGGRIAFVSDRPLAGFPEDTLATMGYGEYQLFVIDVESGEVTPLTSGVGTVSQPDWCPADERIAYISDENGIRNIYTIEAGGGDPVPVTNLLGGAYSPSWSPDGKQMVFSAFSGAGWDIYHMRSIRPYATENGQLDPSAFLEEGGPKLLPPVTEVAGSDSVRADTTERRTDYSTYVFTSGPEPEVEGDTIAARDTLRYVNEDGSYRVRRYRAKFSPDVVAGMVGYDSFYGFAGQTLIAISDIMGDHRFIIGFYLTSSIDETDISVAYQNLKHRIAYGLVGFHYLNYYEDYDNNFFSDRTAGGGIQFERPFSMFTRAELSAVGMYINRDYIDPDYTSESFYAGVARAALVHDGVRWGYTGPADGGRWYISGSYAPSIGENSVEFYSGTFDWRRYFRFAKRYSIAVRASGGALGGEDAQRFYLGGTSAWIASTSARSDIYEAPNLYFGDYVVPLRGYELYELSGTRYGLVNLELRYPFIEYLKMRFPLPITIGYLTGAWFADIGAAWDDDDFKGVSSSGGENNGPHLEDIQMGFGFGARVNLGLFVLKYDAAWRTDLDVISHKPRHYFSLGAEF
jgi:Tol biopolymer transport system component